MRNKVKDIYIKNRTNYFSDIINIKYFDPRNIKIDAKSYKNIFIHCIAYMTMKNSKFVKVNSANTLYLMLIKMNGYFEKINGKMCMMKNIKKLNVILDDELPLNKTTEIPVAIVVVRAVFYEQNKYQFFLGECLYQI